MWEGNFRAEKAPDAERNSLQDVKKSFIMNGFCDTYKFLQSAVGDGLFQSGFETKSSFQESKLSRS